MITKLLLLINAVVLSTGLYGNSIFDQPAPNKFINDYANLLMAFQEQELESKVISFFNISSIQIAIVTVKSLEGMAPGQFSQKLAHQWGVGERSKNNGILIVVKPKYNNEKGEVYISVGYGLEHVIPDAIANRIVNEILIPNFKKDNFYDGLNKAVDRIIYLSSGEYTHDKDLDLNNKMIVTLIIILLIITFFVPVLYLNYLKDRKIPDSYSHFYIDGAYTAENIFKQIDLIEKKNGKKYKKFKRQVKQYEQVSKKNLIKYSDRIDRNMFCYLLDGRNRTKMFWIMADPFLKIIGIYLISILLFGSVLVLFKTNIVGFIIALVVAYVVINGLFSLLITFIEMYQHILRKKAKYVGGVSVALFALNAFFKGNIRKRYDAKTNSYSYYPHVVLSSGSYSGGGFGSFGGRGGGGFGGGGFGGGGAGGSW